MLIPRPIRALTRSRNMLFVVAFALSLQAHADID